MVPVCGLGGGILGFVYDDVKDYMNYEKYLRLIEDHIHDALFIQEIYPQVRSVCIMDCNEYAYRIYQLCRKKELPVCVIGEKWEWFGIPSYEGFLEYPEYEKFYIYAEGVGNVREEKEYQLGKYEYIGGAFEFLGFIIRKNTVETKIKIVDGLERKGISICEVVIPEDRKIIEKTPIELASARNNALFSQYMTKYDDMSEYARELTEEIYGKEIFEYVHNKGIVDNKKGRKYINYGDLSGYYVSEVLHEKKIYLIGPCIVRGFFVKMEKTLVAKLQKKVEEKGYTVIGCVIDRTHFDRYQGIKYLPIRKQDIVLFVDSGDYCVSEVDKTINHLDVLELYNQKGRPTWYEGNETLHLNAAGISALSDFIYHEYLKQKIEEKNILPVSEGWEYLQKGQVLSEEQKEIIYSYINEIRIYDTDEEMQIGAIVMNCNPFTLGHQYLAEYAALQVDRLYLFVVQEDQSMFSFQRRFNMVKEGVKHLGNVQVVPSGTFILSAKTMPIYFEKEEQQEAIINASIDLEIFGRYVAPMLHIKRRFVGEEPYDNVTRQYNEQMKMILLEYGIEVEEIPRREYKNEAISASRVRKLLEEGKVKECRELVPEYTWEVLQEMFHVNSDMKG